MIPLDRLAEIYPYDSIELFGDAASKMATKSETNRSKLAVSSNYCQGLTPSQSDEHIDYLVDRFHAIVFTAGAPGSGKAYNGTDQLTDYWISQFQIRGLVPIDFLLEGGRLPLLFAKREEIEAHPGLQTALATTDLSWRDRFKTGAGEVRAPDPLQRIGPDTSGQDRKIAASVVTYQPTPEQLECIKHLAAIFPSVIVADNSEPPAAALPGVEWVSMGGNKGIAAGLNAACKRAKELGYEWLLTLDQDTDIDSETLEQYLNEFRKFDDKDCTAIIAPRTDGRDQILAEESATRELEMVMTSGCLTNLDIWEKVGGFAEELFIDEVDHEYCLHARKEGYRVVRLLNAYLPHQPGKVMTIIARRGPTLVGWHPPRRLYYIVRNYFFMKRRYREVFPDVIAERRRLVIAKFKEYLLYHPNRWPAVLAMTKGAFHGVIGRFGR